MGQPKFLQAIWVPKLGIAFGRLFRLSYAVSTYIKQPHHPNFAKSYSYIIGAFHRALDGRMFGHKLQENGGNVACPIASEYNRLKAFSFKSSTPQNKLDFRCKLLHEFCKR
ncbi:hypothetical protein GmHk_03G007251 [Glycine max]|nr:hypothetical protein GmHk_03G007251 [Glycine max]